MPQMYPGIRTPPFLSPEQERMMAQNLPRPMEELPEAPPLPPGRGSMPKPPMDFGPMPDPTMLTNRPERPMPEAYRKWKESEEDLNNIQGQRPRLEDNKPSLWNRLAGGIAGGLGGYLASSPSAVARESADKAFALAPKLLRPGYDQKMQKWDSDLKMAQDRSKRAKAGLDTDINIEESRSNQDYKEAAANYQRQLPEIAREKSRANMVTITPESVKELNLPDDMVGQEVPASFWRTFVQERSYGAKSKADLGKKQIELEATMDRLRELRDSIEQEGARNRASREGIASGANKTKVTTTGISANKKKGARTTPSIKDGDRYYMGILDPDTKEVDYARDGKGERIEVAPPRKDDDDASNPYKPDGSLKADPKPEPKPEPKSEPKPATPSAKPAASSTIRRQRIVRDKDGKLIKEPPNAKTR